MHQKGRIPKLAPVAAIANARPVLLEKYVDTSINPDANMTPMETPINAPWTPSNWGYVVHQLVDSKPRNSVRLAPWKQCRKYPLLTRGLETKTQKKLANNCTDPIQARSDRLLSRSIVVW